MSSKFSVNGSQFSAYGPNSYPPFYIPPPGLKEDYSKVVNIVEDKTKAAKISVILSYLFSNTIREIQISQKENYMWVQVEHPMTQARPLPSLSTSLYATDRVIFLIAKNGQIVFPEKDFAPYEQVELLSLNIWSKIDIIDDTVHIGSNNVGSRIFPIANQGGISTPIPFQAFVNALAETK